MDLTVSPPTPFDCDLSRLQRVAIIGTSCAGKTTLARRLSRLLQIPHIEWDALHWGPNWTPQPAEAFAETLREAVAGERWITDGNDSADRQLVWPRSTTILWQNYPFPRIFGRAVRRTAWRMWTQEELFSGNRERCSLILSGEFIPW